MAGITDTDLQKWFGTHVMGDAEYQHAKAIAQAARAFAEAVRAHTKPSADQTAAIRKIREACMTSTCEVLDTAS